MLADEHKHTARYFNRVHRIGLEIAKETSLKNYDLQGDVHKLRNTFASNLVMKGSPLYDVQRLLGHRDIKTTMIYAHLSPDYLKESVKKLE